jgi:hypothetical protein
MVSRRAVIIARARLLGDAEGLRLSLIFPFALHRPVSTRRTVCQMEIEPVSPRTDPLNFQIDPIATCQNLHHFKMTLILTSYN